MIEGIPSTTRSMLLFSKNILSEVPALLRDIRETRAKTEYHRKAAPYAERCKAVRKELEVTQEELAILLGVSKNTIRNWEQARTIPDSAAAALLVVLTKHPGLVIHALNEQ